MHLIAWTVTFPTQFEKKLWRVSSLGHALFIPVKLLILVFRTLLGFITHDGDTDVLGKAIGSRVEFLDGLVLTALFVMPALHAVYVSAKIYIVVECCLNLGYLPDGAYEVIRWSQYVSHIG